MRYSTKFIWWKISEVTLKVGLSLRFIWWKISEVTLKIGLSLIRRWAAFLFEILRISKEEQGLIGLASFMPFPLLFDMLGSWQNWNLWETDACKQLPKRLTMPRHKEDSTVRRNGYHWHFYESVLSSSALMRLKCTDAPQVHWSMTHYFLKDNNKFVEKLIIEMIEMTATIPHFVVPHYWRPFPHLLSALSFYLLKVDSYTKNIKAKSHIYPYFTISICPVSK